MLHYVVEMVFTLGPCALIPAETINVADCQTQNEVLGRGADHFRYHVNSTELLDGQMERERN